MQAFCQLTAQQALPASSTLLQYEVWVDLEPYTKEGPLPRPSDEVLLRSLLDEARILASALIYGYEFSYRPGDKARQIEDRIELNPVYQIPWGDTDLSVVSSRIAEGSAFLRFSYQLKEREQARVESWQRSDIPVAGGTGEASYFLGVEGKFRAFEDAVRDAVRNHARALTLNKPAYITGMVVLEKVPRVYVRSGSYRFELKARLRVLSLEPYLSY